MNSNLTSGLTQASRGEFIDGLAKSKGSQVPGSTFKVGDKDRIDDPKTWQSMLSLPNGFDWTAGFQGCNGEHGAFHGKTQLQSGIREGRMQP
jgi:hypothetical protein